MANFIQFFTSGLLVGGLYALIALGVVIILKATGIFNFAQGMIMMVGGYVCWTVMSGLGLPIWVSILITFIIAAVFGFAVERLLLRPLIGQPILSAILMTLALSYFLNGLVVAVWQGKYQLFPQFIPSQAIKLGGAIFSSQLIIAFVVAMIVFGIFTIIFLKTRVGLFMRATSEDHQLAQATGIGVKGIFGLTWAIGVVLATIGGILLGSINGLNPAMADVGLKAFPAVLLGGLESIPGALIGGISIGILEIMAASYLDPLVGGGIRDVAPFVILLVVLIFKPYGLFGLAKIERV